MQPQNYYSTGLCPPAPQNPYYGSSSAAAYPPPAGAAPPPPPDLMGPLHVPGGYPPAASPSSYPYPPPPGGAPGGYQHSAPPAYYAGGGQPQQPYYNAPYQQHPPGQAYPPGQKPLKQVLGEAVAGAVTLAQNYAATGHLHGGGSGAGTGGGVPFLDHSSGGGGKKQKKGKKGKKGKSTLMNYATHAAVNTFFREGEGMEGTMDEERGVPLSDNVAPSEGDTVAESSK
ncbi:Annexin [Balamuthia mandrillaris]